MKTNFLNALKQRLFLFIAVLGTFISYAQSTQNPTIGGSKTPDTGGLLDIGGKQAPPPTPFTTTSKYDIGGRGDVGTGLLVIGGKSTDANDIGGRQDVPTMPYGYEIGGRDSSGGLGSYASNDFQNVNYDIGGKGTGSDSGVGQKSYDIGGRNTGGELTLDIGGRSQDPLFTIVSNLGSTTTLRVYS
ncbi:MULTISPECIES: hypothetical protein [Flavobacterium]|jgi:hypothetical protein|uniref:hypothetical protein n=1 Tax=Flavobacterium TaxID=237 RepID=UPI0013896AEC|nr:hypothetical protein [Flavobacterium phycosphaerae]